MHFFSLLGSIRQIKYMRENHYLKIYTHGCVWCVNVTMSTICILSSGELSLNDSADQSSLQELCLHCVIALSVTSSGMNCVQVHHFRCTQTRTRDPRLSRHVSRGVNCHPQHASVTCPLLARANEWASERVSALYPFENYCLQISAYCAPWDRQEFRQIVCLSLRS